MRDSKSTLRRLSGSTSVSDQDSALVKVAYPGRSCLQDGLREAIPSTVHSDSARKGVKVGQEGTPPIASQYLESEPGRWEDSSIGGMNIMPYEGSDLPRSSGERRKAQALFDRLTGL